MSKVNKATYALDANVLIESAKRHYGFDIAPGFWELLEAKAKNSECLIIDRIYDEVIEGKDAIANWLREKLSQHVLGSDSSGVAGVYGEIMAWANEPARNYKPSAYSEFASGNDAWLIAYSKMNSLTVVTDEGDDSANRKKILIPVVCRAFQVRCINTSTLLRELGVKLVLA